MGDNPKFIFELKTILNRHYFFYGLIAAFAIYLLYYNIGQTPFWDDEAMVSWFGRIFSDQQRFIGYDGYNGFMYRNGALFNYKNPPLDILYSAFIQKLFGSGELMERSMFALFSVGSLALFFLIIEKTNENDFWKKIAFIFFALNINFLLFGNECRYYPFSYFFAILLYFLLLSLELKASKNQIFIQITIALTLLLFYLAHYTQALVWLLLTLHFVFSKFEKAHWLEFRVLFSAILFIVILCIWHGISINILQRADLDNLDNFFLKYAKLAYWYIADLHRFCILSLLGLLPFFFYKFRNQFFRTKKNKFLIQQILLFSIAIILTSPQDTSRSSMFDVRYVQSSLFLFAILNASILDTLLQIKWLKKWQIISLVIVLTTSNLLYYIPLESPIQWTTIGLIYEKNTNYRTPFTEVREYLDTISDTKIKTIASIPEFNNTLLLSYFSQRFKISNSIISNVNVSDSIIRHYNLENSYVSNIPDLVILYGRNEKAEKIYNISLKNYSKIDTIRTFANGGMDFSRPEVAWHSFQSNRSYNINKEAIYILRK
jgi:hypothetical protein